MKNKTFIALASAAALMCAAVPTAAFAEDNGYSYERYTFDQLLDMSDDEFIELDSFHGEDRPGIVYSQLITHKYRSIAAILSGSSDRITVPYGGDDTLKNTEEISWRIGLSGRYHVCSGDSEEDLEAYYSSINTVAGVTNVYGKDEPVYAVIEDNTYPDASEDPSGAVYYLMGKITPVFYLDGSDAELSGYEPVSFISGLKEVFGETLGFKVTPSIDGGGVFVEFDAPECTEIDQDSVLYYSKIFYALTSVEPNFSYRNQYIFGNEDPIYDTAKELFGDANADSRLTLNDAVAVLQYVALPEKYPLTAQGQFNADCDGEEGITGKDALWVQQKDAGLF